MSPGNGVRRSRTRRAAAPRRRAVRTKPRRRRAPAPPHAGTILARSLDERWKACLRNLRRTRAHFSEKAVHDLRVATRRLLASVDIVLAVLPDEEMQRRRRRLKRQVDLFDPLRDTQVQLLAFDELLGAHTAGAPFGTMLRLRERVLVRRLSGRLQRIRPAVLGRTIAAMRRQVLEVGEDPAGREALRAAMIGSAGMAFTRCVQLLRAVDPDRTTTIHRLRLAFKRFRYRMEALAPLVGTVGEAELKAMNAYQVRMGEVQDSEVMIRSFNEFVLQRPPASRAGLRPLQMELLRRRTAAVEEFLRGADDLHRFWEPLRTAASGTGGRAN